MKASDLQPDPRSVEQCARDIVMVLDKHDCLQHLFWREEDALRLVKDELLRWHAEYVKWLVETKLCSRSS